MILVGLDDTDTPESAGTNQLARRLVASLPPGFEAVLVLRHQLLFDPRVPYTSKNGSASILLRKEPGASLDALVDALRREMRAWYVAGSDPGLCIATSAPPDVVAFGRRCQRELVAQAEARALAAAAGIHLEGLGGTEDGVIGALAAVGLLASGDDGRVVHRPGWEWPDTFAGPRPVAEVRARGVDVVREHRSGAEVTAGVVDVGKHLRPAYRGGRVVLFVEATEADAASGVPPAEWRALKLP
ncbi:MAG: ABC transporter substrate-binding protein [Gemmatimonadetes bacterium]|nr:ABC transporter substrate-binding protein [Gemmatimonadota bacterium]